MEQNQAEPLIITKITAQKRSRDRLNIFANGEFLCGAAYEVVVAEQLKSGTLIDDALRHRLADADNAWLARQYALSLLGSRARARGELIDRLRRKGFDESATSHAISEVARIGLIDDHAFAELWVRDRLRLRPRGGSALVSELTRKRVAPDVARAAVARVMEMESVDEAVLCMDAARRWYDTRSSGSAAGDLVRTQRRLHGYLVRRGYPHAAVSAAVRAVLRSGGSS
jgi:regulatory protein